MTLPGPNSETRGYWPGAWTMGNLGRPGYAGTSWPYTYDLCNAATFPNQTLQDNSRPVAALHCSLPTLALVKTTQVQPKKKVAAPRRETLSNMRGTNRAMAVASQLAQFAPLFAASSNMGQLSILCSTSEDNTRSGKSGLIVSRV